MKIETAAAAAIRTDSRNFVHALHLWRIEMTGEGFGMIFLKALSIKIAQLDSLFILAVFAAETNMGNRTKPL